MTTTVLINRNATVASLEARLAQIAVSAADDATATMRLASNVEGGMLGDIWSAILATTVCRRLQTQVTAWGLSGELPIDSDFVASPACLACAPIASSIVLEDGQEIDALELMRAAATRHRGLVRPEGGAVQTLVEFDPEFSIAPGLKTRFDSARDAVARRRLFERLVLYFRSRLEIGALRRGQSTVALGAAGDVGRFLAELHENGLQHGSLGPDGARRAGTRFLRARKHIANHRDELLRRADTFPALRQYIAETFRGQGATALIEVSISDSGLGIVDGFLSTPAGRASAMPRRNLLEALIYDRLTSKSDDPGAGLGIRKALIAAQSMQAFVSLRTGEFWLCVAFLPNDERPRLTDVGTGAHPPVAGTHWQILWPQP
jgi:hypothetical protein